MDVDPVTVIYPTILPSLHLPGVQLGTRIREDKDTVLYSLCMTPGIISEIRCVIVVTYLKHRISHTRSNNGTVVPKYFILVDGLLVRRQIRNSLAEDSGTFGPWPALLIVVTAIRPWIPPLAAFSTTLC